MKRWLSTFDHAVPHQVYTPSACALETLSMMHMARALPLGRIDSNYLSGRAGCGVSRLLTIEQLAPKLGRYRNQGIRLYLLLRQ